MQTEDYSQMSVWLPLIFFRTGKKKEAIIYLRKKSVIIIICSGMGDFNRDTYFMSPRERLLFDCWFYIILYYKSETAKNYSGVTINYKKKKKKKTDGWRIMWQNVIFPITGPLSFHHIISWFRLMSSHFATKCFMDKEKSSRGPFFRLRRLW